jgi:hypothetical protein
MHEDEHDERDREEDAQNCNDGEQGPKDSYWSGFDRPPALPQRRGV